MAGRALRPAGRTVISFEFMRSTRRRWAARGPQTRTSLLPCRVTSSLKDSSWAHTNERSNLPPSDYESRLQNQYSEPGRPWNRVGSVSALKHLTPTPHRRAELGEFCKLVMHCS